MSKITFKPSDNFFKNISKYASEMGKAPAKFASRVLSFLEGRTKFFNKYRPLSDETFGTMKAIVKKRVMRPASFNFVKRTKIPNFRLSTKFRGANSKEDIRKLIELRRKVIKNTTKYFKGGFDVRDIEAGKKEIPVIKRKIFRQPKYNYRRTIARKERVLAQTMASYNNKMLVVGNEGRLHVDRFTKSLGIIKMRKHTKFGGFFV